MRPSKPATPPTPPTSTLIPCPICQARDYSIHKTREGAIGYCMACGHEHRVIARTITRAP